MSLLTKIWAACSALQKEEQEKEKNYRPAYQSKQQLSRLRAEIVGLGASLRYEKCQLKRKFPETLTVKRKDGSGHYDKIYPRASHQALHTCLKADLKASVRAKLVAYGILRGKNYKDVESAERLPKWWPSYDCSRLVADVAKECSKQGFSIRDQKWFKDPINIKNLMMNGEVEKLEVKAGDQQ